ncbi:hypothetical protein MtrunA17_Chr6g0467151 [Medicago truncatula]|uniref:Transmembrane protein n=1 Tax=Medicago truncatula TaxID=3880 RepID=A0A396HDD5_MEDTR|nr:hypothetical protein MtrunA17_Chr6g0467151 [Medicago truncatula]
MMLKVVGLMYWVVSVLRSSSFEFIKIGARPYSDHSPYFCAV